MTQTKIRAMTAQDRDSVLKMMEVFYASPAVSTNGSYEIFCSDFENCVQGSPYLEGYMIEGDTGLQGYAMVAKSFSTEFGKPCIWIEDLYLKEEYRGLGVGKQFFDFITAKYTNCVFRLEVEPENSRAVRLYERSGFTELPYLEMVKESAEPATDDHPTVTFPVAGGK